MNKMTFQRSTRWMSFAVFGLLSMLLMRLQEVGVHAMMVKDATCSKQTGVTIKSADVAPHTFVFSAEDCCNYCANISACVAAVYQDYKCSPKGTSTTDQDPLATVLTPSRAPPTTLQPSSTPAPAPPVTTAAPHSAAPTATSTTTTTAHPTVGPTPPTPAPTTSPSGPTGKIFLQVTYCSDEYNCNAADSDACTFQAYEPNVCYEVAESLASYQYVLTQGPTGPITRWDYASYTNCTGTATMKLLPQGFCTKETSGSILIMVQPEPTTPVPGRYAIRTQTYNNVSDSTLYPEGSCMEAVSAHSNGGGFIKAMCGDGFVLWRTYSDSACTGKSSTNGVPPINLTYEDGDSDLVTWTCAMMATESPSIPPGPAGVPVRRLVGVKSCTYSSNCSLEADSSCVNRVTIDGECEDDLTNAVSVRRYCVEGGKGVIVENHATLGCGNPVSERLYPAGACLVESSSDGYHQMNCYEVPETTGLDVTWQACNNESGGMVCDNRFYVTGACGFVSDDSNRGGVSIQVYCGATATAGGDEFPQHVWWSTYNTQNCTGPAVKSHLLPESAVFADDESDFVQWKCFPQPPTPPPAKNVLSLVNLIQCDTEATTCNREQHVSCTGTPYFLDRCYQVSTNQWYNSYQFVCFSNYTVKVRYQNTNCTGPTSSSFYDLDQCKLNDDDSGYNSYQCLTLNEVEQKGDKHQNITLEVCTPSPGSNCTTTSFIPGVCNNALVVYCGGSFVYVKSYDDSSCEAVWLTEENIVPANVELPQSDGGHKTWKCSLPH